MLCLLIAIDFTNLIRKSIDMGQPIIVVSLNYRLNMFAFGDCKGEMNITLSDQRTALDFIRLHIRGFGGDPVAHSHIIFRSMLHAPFTEQHNSRRRKRWRRICPCPHGHGRSNARSHPLIWLALSIPANPDYKGKKYHSHPRDPLVSQEPTWWARANSPDCAH
jgi:hypothetical protein